MLLVKVEPGSAYNPAFCFAGPLGVGTPTSLIDYLCSNDIRALSDSYCCDRLTNDDAWYVLLISKCLLRHIVWSIKCWIQWKMAITNWRSRRSFIFLNVLFYHSSCSKLKDIQVAVIYFKEKQHVFKYTHARETETNKMLWVLAWFMISCWFQYICMVSSFQVQRQCCHSQQSIGR